MKTFTQHPQRMEILRNTNKLLLTAGMLICVTAGWCLGNLTSQVFDKQHHTVASISNNIILHAVPINGKTLPTIMLKEFPVIAGKH